MKDPQENVRQHARMAMGKNIGHPAGAGRGYSKGGIVAQGGGQAQSDKTTYQKYGMGYRKVQGK